MIATRAQGPPLQVPDWTLVDVVRRAAREHGERPALLDRHGRVEATWRDLERRARSLAARLLTMGLRPGDRVGIVSETRAEWVVADLAILMAGCVTVSTFPTLPPAQLAEALRRSRVRVAFVEDAAVLARCARGDAADAPVERYVSFEPLPALDDALAKRATTLALLEGSRADEDAEVDARSNALRADDVAAIIYTSGTTGRPKGVMLTHRNLVANSLGAIEHLGFAPHPVGLAFLPLAHSYQRQSGVVLALLAGSVAFSTPARLSEDLPRVRPTLLPAVPRLYERMHARIHATVRRQPRRRQRVFAVAEATARARGKLAMRREAPPLSLRLRHALFERLVYRRIRRMAGLDRLDLAITGAAAMRQDLLEFFWGIGVPIVEGYGLTETAAPSTANPPHDARAGSVGTPLPGVEVAIAEDGEILIAGPHVFVGYDGLEDDTREAFVELEGRRWLRTGDLGAIEDGHLRVLDRKKDLEVLDTGKNVAPQPIEEALKASPLVAEAVVVADGRKFVGCLIQPDFDALLAWAAREDVPHDAARARRGSGATGEQEVLGVEPALVEHPRVVEAFAREVERVNEALPRHEQVKAFRLLPTALSLDAGEITPTLKKRRRAILEARRADVDALFAGQDAAGSSGGAGASAGASSFFGG